MIQHKLILVFGIFLATVAIVYASALPEANAKRCGNDDGNLDRSKRFTTFHSGHKNKTISYRVSTYTKDLTNKEVDDVLKQSFDIWSKHTDLKFVQVQPDEPADIDILFGVGEHGCGYPFDGPGQVLAHANRNYLHFDDDEQWKVEKSAEGVSLYKTAVHEIGHTLGLHHTNIEGAIMFPWYSGDDEDNLDLHSDDITGIESIYGVKKDFAPYSEDICKDPSFDTMFETPDDKLYIFKKDKYFELDGQRILDGPKPIADKWKGLPDSINGAFTQNDKTYFFKDDQYWSFTGYEMDQNYPAKLINGVPAGIDDVTVLDDGKVYFFKGSKVFIVDRFNEQSATVEEKLIADEFKGIPNDNDAVHYSKNRGTIVFFKADNFSFFETQADRVTPYVLPITSYYFGCRKD